MRNEPIPSWVTPGADLVLMGGGWNDMIRGRVRVTRVLTRDVVAVVVRNDGEVTEAERRYRMDGRVLREAGEYRDRYAQLLPADHPRVVMVGWVESMFAPTSDAEQAAAKALTEARRHPGRERAAELETLAKQITELAAMMAAAPVES